MLLSFLIVCNYIYCINCCSITLTQYTSGIPFDLSKTYQYVSRQINCNIDVNIAENDVDVYSAIENNSSQMFLVPSAIDVCLERLYDMNYLTCLVATTYDGQPTSVYGGQILTKTNRSDINKPEDLIGKNIAAVQIPSEGGFLLQWYELYLHYNINVLYDSNVILLDNFQGLYDLLQEGIVDVIFTVAGIKQVDQFSDNYKVLIPREYPGYPFEISTSTVPQIIMLVQRNTYFEDLYKNVTLSLLNIPYNSNITQGNNQANSYWGWINAQSNSKTARIMSALGIISSENGMCVDSENLYDILECPTDYIKNSKSIINENCNNNGLRECDVEYQCICQPCEKKVKSQKSLIIYLVSLLPALTLLSFILILSISIFFYVIKKQKKRLQIYDDQQIENVVKNLFDDIELIKFIAKGNFGCVYLAKWSGINVAVKNIKTTNAAITDEILAKPLVHDNIVRIYDYRIKKTIDTIGISHLLTTNLSVIDENECLKNEFTIYELFIILEYCPKGNISDNLSNPNFCKINKKPFNVHIILTLLDIANGIKYLHEKKITHSDLNCNNILLESKNITETDTRDFRAKISDFGMSISKEIQNDVVKARIYGCISHMSPETISNGTCNFQTDIYAFGIIIWEISNSKKAYYNIDQNNIIDHVLIKNLRPIFENCTDLSKIATSCWDVNPEKRPTIDQVIDKLSYSFTSEIRYS